MPSSITPAAVERSTYVLTLTFTDSGGTAVTPSAITWTLTRKDTGAIVNEREDIDLTPVAGGTTLVLSGADLQVYSGDASDRRLLTVEWTYDADEGNDLPGKDQIDFQVLRLDAVP